MPQPLSSTPRQPANLRAAPRTPAPRRPARRRPRLVTAPVAQSGPGVALGGERDDGAPPGSRGAAGAGRPGKRAVPLRVLVVEDEAVISIELEDMLEGLGCTVVGVAHTAAEAVRLAERERPDLITMDVSLPGQGDGVSAATEIFERHGLRSLFITAYTDAETVARARPACPLGWLRKPVTVRGLAAAIEDLPDPEAH